MAIETDESLRPQWLAGSLRASGLLHPLGLLAVSIGLQATVLLHLLLYVPSARQMPHALFCLYLTTIAALTAMVWVHVRGLGLVAAEDAQGFGLVAYAISARTLAEMGAYIYDRPELRVRLANAEPPGLVMAVRHTGTLAYAVGITLVVASSLRSVRSRQIPRQQGWARALMLVLLGAALAGAALRLAQVVRVWPDWQVR